MQNIGYITDKLLRNHIYKIIVIDWISYRPFEQPGPGDFSVPCFIGSRPQFRLLVKYILKTVQADTDRARFDRFLLMIKY